MNKYNAKKTKDECVEWIRDWFGKNGNGCVAVVGISGGIDSAVVAALCCEALGSGRVKGIMMPNGKQADIKDAEEVCEFLKIGHFAVDIKNAVDEIELMLKQNGIEVSESTKINLPARVRMSTLYAFSQSMHGRVANTCNLSETWVGYDTRWGDAAGDFAPIQLLTKTEVRELAKLLGIPESIINKAPSDGLCGKSDEDRFGFTYEELDRYIRNIPSVDADNEKINKMHNRSIFKMKNIPCYPYKAWFRSFLDKEY